MDAASRLGFRSYVFAEVDASLELKIRVWNALVRPVLLYGYGDMGANHIPHREAMCLTL